MDSLISIIIPTYNRSFDMLSKAIQSALTQTYEKIELIIVDDNHPDSDCRKEISTKIAAIADDKLHYIQHDKNMGACRARNTGIKHARGEFLAFLDDDDEWDRRKLELQMEKMRDPEVGLVYCSSRTIITGENNVTAEKIRSYKISGYVFEELLQKNFIGSTSFVLIRKKVIEECGGFNEELTASQDYELWLRIALKYKVDFVDVPLVNYYIHSGERISTNTKNKIQSALKINQLYSGYFQKYPKAYVNRLIRLTLRYFKVKQFSKGIRSYLEALRIAPGYCVLATAKKISNRF